MPSSKLTLKERKSGFLEAASSLRVDVLRKKLDGMDQQTLNRALLVALGQKLLVKKRRAFADWGRNDEPQVPQAARWQPTAWQQAQIKKAEFAYYRGEVDQNNAYRLSAGFQEADRFAMCEALLRAGADPRANAQECLSVAIENWRENRFFDLLIEHGAKPSGRDVLSELVKRGSGHSLEMAIMQRRFYADWSFLVKKGANAQGGDAKSCLIKFASRGDWRAFEAFWATMRFAPEVASEALRSAAEGLGNKARARSAMSASAPDPVRQAAEEIRDQQERLAVARRLLAVPGIAEQPFWESAVAQCASKGWLPALDLALKKSGPRAKQRVLWMAWRADSPEIFGMALRHGASLDEQAQASESGHQKSELAMFRQRSIKEPDGRWVKTGEVPLLSINEARANSDYSHLGAKCNAWLDSRAMREELMEEFREQKALESSPNAPAAPSEKTGSAAGGATTAETPASDAQRSAPAKAAAPSSAAGPKSRRRL